jgi:hypothetical protein
MLRKVEAELLTRNLLNNTTWRNRERGEMSRFAKLEIKTVDEHKTRRREVRFWLSDRLEVKNHLEKRPTRSQKSLISTIDSKSEVMEEDETKDFEWK